CGAEPAASYMTWAQISQLKNTYGWEIASHTVTHPLLASSDPSFQPSVLTPTQVDNELTTSKLSIGTNTGVTPTDFATPYGDWTPPVLAQIARVYASHRGFADNIDQNGDGVIDHGNTYPYNDYLLYDYQVQAGVTVAQVENIINQTKANNQWLILTFHDISPTASTNPDNYQYNTADLDAIAAYVKAQGIPVVNINGGLVTNVGNLLANSSFDAALSSNTADTTAWSTDSPTTIKQDSANNGNYPSPANSALLTGTAANTHLFSPRVAVDGTKTYVLKNYLNVTNMAVAAGHEIAFYIDEYDASGAYLGATARYMKSEVGNAANPTGAWVENLNFTYTPTATAKFARLQLVVTANSGAKVYLDNVQWFAEDGSTTGGQGAVGKAGDVNGDGAINALDLSILLSHWNQAGATHATGDLSGDAAVNALDLSILLSNWGK
ncbi:polysaccharide deacetylase family protein, partial [Candidatus Saccharibacteria bacterium]|nr:polysaccharide deacetylase family protein [Candidatus Saccharibacteria bacterium]